MSYKKIPDKIVEISNSRDTLFGLTESGDLYEFTRYNSQDQWSFVMNSPLVEVENIKVRPPRPESK